MLYARLAAIIAIGWSIFQMYTAGFGFLHVMLQRPIHVALALAVTFLTYPLIKPKPEGIQSDEDAPKNAQLKWYDFALALLSLAAGLYLVISSDRIIPRVYFVDKVFTSDVVVGSVLILLILEAGRRVVGWPLPTVAIVFLLYQFWGSNLPGILKHSGIAFGRFFDMQILSPNGVFGTPIGVATDTVFYFLLFSAFLEISGGGKFFVDMALRLTGRYRGGPAKVAIVGSSLMGTINGSAVANVAGTGVFTIPLMKRAGYPAIFAGAVEACASTGGQIMPPIMGAAAFVMAQMLGVSYPNVAIAAIVPALAYYAALFIAVDIKAKDNRLAGLDLSEMTDLGQDLKNRAHLMLPLLLLIWMLFSGRSLMLSALAATLLVIPVAWLRKDTRLYLKAIIGALESAGRRAVVVSIPCAVAGIIIGVVTFTGLGLKFSNLLITISGGNLFLALILVMVGCLVLGMGMPTTAGYIIAAVLMAPALINLGVAPMAAHMFVFYFACLSMITPPVALAAYAGAGIAGTDPMKTGYQAWLLAISGFIIPFAFVADNAMLMQGSVIDILRVGGLAIVGTYGLAKGLIGSRISTWLRVGFIVSGVCLIDPRLLTDVVGIAGLILCSLLQLRYEKYTGVKRPSVAR